MIFWIIVKLKEPKLVWVKNNDNLLKSKSESENESFSKPFVYKNSVFSLYKYLYEKEKEITFEDLYLKWDYFESLALQTKRNVYIEEWINTKKRDFYVKIY